VVVVAGPDIVMFDIVTPDSTLMMALVSPGQADARYGANTDDGWCHGTLSTASDTRIVPSPVRCSGLSMSTVSDTSITPEIKMVSIDASEIAASSSWASNTVMDENAVMPPISVTEKMALGNNPFIKTITINR